MNILARKRQRGAALILFATVLILGVAWYAVGALSKAPVATAEREIKTGLALQEAKRALLAYVVQYAARSDTADPGEMPCPEALTLANPGEAASTCSASAIVLGRLPWKTLGIDQLRDGQGEPLWYMMRGFRDPPINFGTSGQLAYDGAAVIAMIIAPGRPLNTLSDPGTPPAGCSKLNQNSATRNSASLNPANFLECGTGTGSIASPGDSLWTNDRVIAISAAEWADAIAPAVYDRIQRQVAPVLGDWHQLELAATGKSWAAAHGISYLPFASSWGNPTTNNYCGNDGIREGLAPIAQGCYDNSWTGNSSDSGGLNYLGCSDQGTYLRCRFRRDFSGPLNAQITATAVRVARTYRSTIRATDLTVSNSGTATLSMALSASTSDATATINVSWSTTMVASGNTVTVDIPHLVEAAALSDSRLAWFRTNNWHYYTYYAIAPAVAAPAIAACNPGTTCLTAAGLPASTGAANDKRMVLVLTGRPIAGQTQPSGTLANYLEGGNATTLDNSFASAAASSVFNDRLAVCPFKNTNHSGTDVVICN